ncbi:hypothetical protein MHK_000199 [Candidatus Magnetomorum sp. HK-1]|nr:hypothetical protein MHK_000199 [Candidatus Magnetomorum sp. HK-1]
MEFKFEKSVFLVESISEDIDDFGTAFVIYKDKKYIYLITCAHVVKKVGGVNNILVANYPICDSMISSNCDVALLMIKNDNNAEFIPLSVEVNANDGAKIKAYGFHLFDRSKKMYAITPTNGNFVNHGFTRRTKKIDKIKILNLDFDDDNRLQAGYSGSPVLIKSNNRVIGVISHLIGKGEKGIAISFETIIDIWSNHLPQIFEDKVIESKENRYTVNASELENTNGIILLTGAGASAALGLKTLRGISYSPLDEESDKIRTIIQSIWNKVESNKRNEASFEDIIGQLKIYSEATELMMRDWVFKNEIGDVSINVKNGRVKRQWDDSIIACYKTVLKNYGPDMIDTNKEGYKETIKFIVELSKRNNNLLHIFTTNYDCLYNVIAENSDKISFLTHIDHNGCFDKEWHYIKKEFYQNINTPRVFVNRLHGCVAWFNDNRNPFGLKQISGVGSKLRIRDSIFLNDMLIKLTHDEKVGANPAFSLAFEEFKEELKRCKLLVVWGYSFRDIEVLRAIQTSIDSRKDEPLCILIIDPYLNIEEAMFNFQQTLADIPAIDFTMNTERVKWERVEGDNLISQVMKEIEGFNL